jgi:hypothetical protein
MRNGGVFSFPVANTAHPRRRNCLSLFAKRREMVRDTGFEPVDPCRVNVLAASWEQLKA